MIASSIVRVYAPLFKDFGLDFETLGSSTMYIPKFNGKDLNTLCSEALQKFADEPPLLNLHGEFTVIGDIHGNIRDLLRLLANTGSPFNERYLFLGDFVDRGEFSIEVVTLLFALKVVFPRTIFMIRGNHEFSEVNSNYGFKQQALNEYDETLYNAFNEVFSYLPVAAVINDKYFAVHGGLSEQLTSIEILNQIKKPVTSFVDGNPFSKLIGDMVWSDPISISGRFLESPRGYGSLFGKDAIMEFTKKENIDTIIRAHQCVQNGVERLAADKIITVFSSSSYSKTPYNRAGSLRIESDCITSQTYKPILQLTKAIAVYKEFECDAIKTPMCSRLFRPKVTRSNSRFMIRQSSLNKLVTDDKVKPTASSTPLILQKSGRPRIYSPESNRKMNSSNSLCSLPQTNISKLIPLEGTDPQIPKQPKLY